MRKYGYLLVQFIIFSKSFKGKLQLIIIIIVFCFLFTKIWSIISVNDHHLEGNLKKRVCAVWLIKDMASNTLSCSSCWNREMSYISGSEVTVKQCFSPFLSLTNIDVYRCGAGVLNIVALSNSLHYLKFWM